MVTELIGLQITLASGLKYDTLCVHRQLEENYSFIRVLSKVILCPILIHCVQVSFSELSCSGRFGLKKNTALE